MNHTDDKMARKPGVILFDMDDTFYTTKGPHHCAIDVSLKRFSSLTQTPASRCSELYLQARDSVKLFLGNTASSHSRLLYFQRMLENCEYKSANLDKLEISLELEELYWTSYLQEMPRDPCLEELMITIKTLGIRIGIVTDLTAQIQMRKLMRLGISSHIDIVVTSEESGLDKPNFNCFALANEKINPTNRKLDYWMVGDHLQKDLLGAKIELEARTFWINPLASSPGPLPHFVNHSIVSVHELQPFLKACQSDLNIDERSIHQSFP